MAIEQQKLRQCFGAFMTGVTVVTAMDDRGKPIGFTANSFTSVSLDPPLLLICVDNSSDHIETYRNGSGFMVNILAEDQKDLSNRFASPIEDRFEGIDWQKSENGNPMLGGTAAFFDCSTENVIDAGDHQIIIGRVHNCASNGKSGLGYHRGQYFTLANQQD